jgi:hypothetical protein
MIEPARDPFGPHPALLGYALAILGIAMLIYTFRQISAASEPSAFGRQPADLGRTTVQSGALGERLSASP